jgi:PAS domain-containing protein
LGASCFQGLHAALAATSLLLLPVFVLLAVVVSGLYVNHNPLSDAISSKQHGRMDAYFVLLRLALTVAVDTAGGVLPAWMQWLAQAAVAVFWMYTFIIVQPDTVPWMNQLQAALACAYGWAVTAALHVAIVPGTGSMAVLLLHGAPLSAALGWMVTILHRGRVLGKSLGELSEWHEFVLWSRERLRVQHTAKGLHSASSRGSSIGGFSSNAVRSGGYEYRPEESVARSEMLNEERGGGMGGGQGMDESQQQSLSASAASPSVANTGTVILQGPATNMPLAAARTSSAMRAGIAWTVSHSGGHASWARMLGGLAPATMVTLAVAMEVQAEAGYAAAMSRFPADGLLRVFAAAFYRSTRDSRYMEMVQLNAAKKLSSALDVQFFVHQRIHAVRNKFNGKAGSALSAIDRLLYEQHWNAALRARVACYEAMAEVWSELRQGMPDLKCLERNAISLHSAVTSARGRFDSMLQLHASMKVYAAYGNFLTTVLGDEAEGSQMLQRATQLSQEAEGSSNGSVVQHFRFGERSKSIAAMSEGSAVVTASGDPATIGQITQVNATACRLLARSRADLVGSNVSTIVPRPISDIHNKLMLRYAKTGKGNLMGTTRNLFAVSAGCLIPVRGG